MGQFWTVIGVRYWFVNLLQWIRLSAWSINGKDRRRTGAEPGPNWGRRKRLGSIRRQELAEATLQTLKEVGFRATTVARVSSRAGLAHGLVHHFVKTKSEIIEVANDAQFSRILHVIYVRMRSNLRHCLRELVPVRDIDLVASRIAVTIDGAWMRRAANPDGFDRDQAVKQIHAYVLGRLPQGARAPMGELASGGARI